MSRSFTAAAKRHFLIPKGKYRREAMPALPEHVAELLVRVTPAERQALETIVATADLIDVPGAPFLLVPATPALLDTLAAFDAAQADLEPDQDREACCDQDDDTDNDNAYDVVQLPGVAAGIPLDDEQSPEVGAPPLDARKSREAIIERRRLRYRPAKYGGEIIVDPEGREHAACTPVFRNGNFRGSLTLRALQLAERVRTRKSR
ncbi:MAG: hypothetical protein AB7G15_15475 [Alphaproteobacteria bacterium]